MSPEEHRKLVETEDRMWYFRSLHRRALHWLARMLPAGPVRYLDVGCGTGGLIRRVQAARPDWSATGLDFSPLACELARSRTSATIVEGSIMALPFRDGEFDAAIAFDVVSQIDNAPQAVREMARCVRPGGVVLIYVPAYMWLWSYHDVAVRATHRYRRSELRALIEGAGLKTEFATYVNLLTLPLLVVRRKIFPPAKSDSDVQLQAGPVEATLMGLMNLEHAWTGRGWSLPLGGSVFIAARRPAATPEQTAQSGLPAK